MPDHAGFAAAITVRERVLRDALLFAYSREGFLRTLPIPVQGVGPTIQFVAYLSAPTLTCDATRNAVVVGADLAGLLIFTGPAGAESKGVVAHVDVAVPPEFTLLAGQLALSPAHTDVKVVAWNYTVVGPTGFDPDTNAYLQSPLMLDRLSATVQWALDLNIIPLPSVDVSALGPIVRAADPAPPPLPPEPSPHAPIPPVTPPVPSPQVPPLSITPPLHTTPPVLDPPVPAPVPARVVDGALLAGLNVEGFAPPWQPPGAPHVTSITLQGDPGGLQNFAGGYDVAMITNPAALPILLASAEQAIVDSIPAGATLDSLTLTAGDGSFGIAGIASNSQGHATFSFSLLPHLDAVRPGGAITFIEKPIAIPPRSFAGLWFSTTEPAIDVSVDLDFWDVVLVELGTLVVGGLVLLTIVDLYALYKIETEEEQTRNQFHMAVDGGTSGPPSPLVHRVSSAELNDVTLRIAVEDYSITPDGPFMGITIQPEPKPAALIGPQSIPATLAAANLKYSVRLPVGVVADDPSLNIHWTVIEVTTGAVKVDSDGLAKGRTTFSIALNQIGADPNKCVVGCRVYRTAGAPTTDVFNDLVHLTVRAAPVGPAYVSWAYDVQRPSVGLDPSTSTWTYGGERLTHRRSKIHRVDGCRNAAKRSRYVYSVTEMDALPFPVADIDVHRDELCAYCFYGGPAGLRATL